MIIVMKPNAPIEERNKIIAGLEAKGFKIDLSTGNQAAILGVVGDTSTLNPHDIMVNDWIEKVLRVQEPFKRANRAFHPDDSVIDVGGVKIGGRQMQVIAGPCSVETREQIIGVAKSVKGRGAPDAWRRFQTAYFSVFVPGHGDARTGAAERSKGRNRFAYRYGNHERRCVG